MLEAVGRLARDRRARLAQQELAEQQVVEQRVDVLEVGRQVVEGAAIEDPPDDRGTLEERLRGRRQMVDARRDERLQRVGNPIRPPFPAPPSTSIRIVSSTKSGLPSVRSSSLGRAGGASPVTPANWPSSFSTSASLSSSDRGSSSIAVDRAPSTPSGPRVEELRAREAEDEERPADPVGQVLDEVEQRLLGPMDVLEQEDERLHVGDRLHDLAGGPRDLLRAALALERLHHPGRERQDIGDRLLGAALAELLESLVERVVVGDAGRGPDHLREGQ